MIGQKLPDDLIVQRFDTPSYVLCEKIGEGGFGRVYRAKQVNTNQIVAIKFMSVGHDLDDKTKKRYIERFEREALLCSRLQHPNIVRLLDKGQCNGLFYAVYEYVEGQTLKQYLCESGSINPPVAAQIMTQVLDALAHAHKQGVIHRDIKPTNIMLTKAGAKTHAKVLDFGIGTLALEARHHDHKSLTLTQEALGTPAYSAPEQLRGEPPTAKTDIYVWGLVFIECLTGRPAISGTSLASIFHKQLSQTNVPLPAALAGHPVSAILRRVLHKKASERIASALDVYSELSRLNFSTLVGDISASVTQAQSFQTSNIPAVDDITQFTNADALQTGLTERKQITALCMTLRISASSESHVDIEVANALHRDQLAECVDIAVRFGGTHIATMAESLLFYFGYPLTSDNDSRLCARTALEVTSQINKRNSLLKQTQGLETQIKMGMSTGMVTIHAEAPPEGETVNIATQLAQLADANQILTTDNSKKLLESYLKFQTQPSRQVGLSNQPQPTYLLTAERQVEAFGFLRRNKNNHGLIGRDQELDSLIKMLPGGKKRHDTQQKCAHIYGEAGIGKSRLIFELRIHAQGLNHYVAQCLPEYKNSALYPVFNIIRQKYSLNEQTPHAAVEILRRALGKSENITSEDALTILCSWLAYPLPKDMAAAVHSPDVQKQILFDALIALLVECNTCDSPQSNLVLIEDIHWADPTSLEFVSKLMEDKRFVDSNDVFISTSRSALPPSWQVQDIKSFELAKLDRKKTDEFVQMLFNNTALSPDLFDTVTTRTDGIPLFIEELVDMLKQKELVKYQNGVTYFIDQTVIDEIPSSLRDSLQQKLDSLVYAKETAQLAATFGREFEYDLLVAVSDSREEQLQMDLQELLNVELIYKQRKVGGDSYLFKHALVRDVAYESMLPQARIKGHAKIAALLEQIAHPEKIALLAHHFFYAEQHKKSIEYGLIATNKLLSESAYKEANEIIIQAQQSVRQLHDEDKDNLEIDVLNTYMAVLIHRFGYGCEQLKTTVARSSEIIDRGCVSHERQFITYWGFFAKTLIEPDVPLASQYATRLLHMSRDSSSNEESMVAYSAVCRVETCRGNFEATQTAAQKCEALNNEAIDGQILAKYGDHPLVVCRAFSAVSLMLHGKVDSAIDRHKQSLELATTLKSPSQMASIMGQQAEIHLMRGRLNPGGKDLTRAIELASQAVKISNKYGFYLWLGYSQAILQFSLMFNEMPFDIQVMENSCDLWRTEGAGLGRSWAFCYLAEAYRRLAQYEKAKQYFDLSQQHIEQTGETFFSSEYSHIKAPLYLEPQSPYFNPQQVLSELSIKLSLALERKQFLSAIRIFHRLKEISKPDLPAPLLSFWNNNQQGNDLPEVIDFINHEK